MRVSGIENVNYKGNEIVKIVSGGGSAMEKVERCCPHWRCRQ